MQRKSIGGITLLILTVAIAAIWVFPIYWTIVTSLKSEQEVVSQTTLLPKSIDISSYYFALFDTILTTWYVNSIVTAVLTTLIVLVISVMCAYALSQISFSGRKLIYGIILASFMVPSQALVVSQFVLMHNFGLINSWASIILPQLISPVVIVVYKQFFDSVPKELREAAKLDGCGDFQILFRLYLPLNWGITTALAIVIFIWSWNAFFWPFLVINSEKMMTVTVGITQVKDAFGVRYAREMAVAVLAALPVAIAYLLYQKRVTQALMLSSGIKG